MKGYYQSLFLFVLSLLSVGAFSNLNAQSSHIIDSIQQEIKVCNSDTSKVKLLTLLANKYPLDDHASRFNTCMSALELARKINWNPGMIQANMFLGQCKGEEQNHQESKPFYFEALRICKVMKDTINLAETYNLLGFTYQVLNRFDSALHYYKLCYALRTDLRSKGSLLASIGVVYDNLGDYPKSLDNFTQALSINQKVLLGKDKNIDDSFTNAGLLFSIGEAYLQMKQYNKAIENYQNVLKQSHYLHDAMFEMLSYSGLAKSFVFLGDLNQGLSFYNRALQLAQQTNNWSNEDGILNDIALIYLDKNQIQQAFDAALRSEKIAKSYNHKDVLRKAYTTLGKIYTRKKQYQDAIQHIELGIKICKELGAMADEMDAWKALSETYQISNNPQKALYSYQQYISLRDSVFNIEKANQMTRTDLQFKFDSQQLADSLKQSLAFNLKLQRQRLYTYSSIIGLALMLLLSFYMYRNFMKQKKNNAIISRANETIKREKLVSEDLLLNILPVDVADELKAHGKVQAKLFDHVSVLFTDFVNFTQTAQRLTPQELVLELDTCFQAFDEITSRYKIEKIKTVGDAYLAVSGLPIVQEHHAQELVKAAIEMRDFMIKRRHQLKERTFEIRLGIHSGKVIAGIVGMKKFSYDVWGDTVNTAARMEQSSEAGKINISNITYELIKNDFSCEYRGEFEAKNKGLMKMYFVS